MSAPKPVPGRLCLSRAGHDAGRYYMITRAASEDGYVYIADGRLRRLGKPKRKKLKHLRLTPIVLEEAASRMAAGQGLSDGELRAMIKRTGREKDGEED